MVRIVHAADFHLDSAFGALRPEQARLRRREGRELLERLKNYVNQKETDIVLLCGDLFDGAEVYPETLEQLRRILGEMNAQVFIAPGNHDFYAPKSPYAAGGFPDNVHIFTTRAIEGVSLPELHCTVYGAAFTAPEQAESLLAGFTAPDDGQLHLMALHADVNAAVPRYSPVTEAEIAASGLTYLALGHVHRCGGVLHAGKTAYAYPGCPEGRGFDELGEKGVLAGAVAPGAVELTFVPLARRRYEILPVDVTGKPPLAAIRDALPPRTASDIYRIILTGEAAVGAVVLDALREALLPDFFQLELRDETRLQQEVWARAEEDSLRGLFLQALRVRRDAAKTEQERVLIERAARFGLAALEHRDI